MKIDLHNYEAFLLDHLEGKLGEARERELFAFLEQHPELKAALENFEEIKLEPETVFENKSSLKKAEFDNEALIAYVEGGADARGADEIEALAGQNKAFARELALYKNTILQPETEIKFPNKARLKKRGVVMYLNNPVYLRIAAAVLLLLGLFFLINKFTGTPAESGNKPAFAANKSNVLVPAKENNVITPDAENKLAPESANQEEKMAYVRKNSKNETGVAVKTSNEVKKNEQAVEAVNSNPVSVANTENKIMNTPENVVQSPVFAKENPAATSVADNSTYRSYYNYSADDEDEEGEKPFVASAQITSSRKTFFQKLSKAARKVNALGVRKINAEESNEKNSVTIGGLKVSESFSN